MSVLVCFFATRDLRSICSRNILSRGSWFLVFWVLHLPGTNVALAQPPESTTAYRSITDRSIDWPTWDQWCRVLLLKDYNTRVVVLGASLLGCAGGMVGSFALLRKRALMGDALSHATLPGICLAFIAATFWGGDGKSLLVLHTGATLTGILGIGAILAIRKWTRLKEDVALGAVLSVFFGAGVALLGVIQQMSEGHAAGLESFVYGKTASMSGNDATWIAVAALACVLSCFLLFKEFKLLCFDEGFAGSRGFPVIALDLALMALIVVVTIVGLQAVGLILMVALLVIPAAAARFWTERMWHMVAISAFLGTLSGSMGAAISALFSKLPSGAMIVLVCTCFFMTSMVLGSSRGLLVRTLRRLRLNRAIGRQHLLRAMYEVLEATPGKQPDVDPQIPIAGLLPKRSWSAAQLDREIRRAQRDGLIRRIDDRLCFSDPGLQEAIQLTRQHRLWELYLVTYADIAPGRVDREADTIEHVLEPEIVAELESLLKKKSGTIPASPHNLVPALTSVPPILPAEGGSHG